MASELACFELQREISVGGGGVGGGVEGGGGGGADEKVVIVSCYVFSIRHVTRRLLCYHGKGAQGSRRSPWEQDESSGSSEAPLPTDDCDISIGSGAPLPTDVSIGSAAPFQTEEIENP